MIQSRRFAPLLMLIGAVHGSGCSTERKLAKREAAPKGEEKKIKEVDGGEELKHEIWTRTIFPNFSISNRNDIKEKNGHSFTVSFSPSENPHQTIGDKKFLVFNGGFNFVDPNSNESYGFWMKNIFPASPYAAKAHIYAPFIKDESIPPWNTDRTPIYLEYDGKKIQIGRYQDISEEGRHYHHPIICEKEFDQVCKIDVSSFVKDEVTDIRFDAFLSINLSVYENGKWLDLFQYAAQL